MSNIVKQQFNEVAKHYDEQRRGLIPCFDDFYESAVRWTLVESESPAILDLGAGTGLLSAFLLHKFPQACMTLIDFSDDMLAMAKSRLGSFTHVRYISADYTAFPFDAKYDAVVSSLSIHHLGHAEKQELFRTIHGILKPGGCFVNADQAAGSTPSIDEQYHKLWDDDVEASGLDSAAIQASRRRKEQDRNAHLLDQLQWLEDAGFRHVDCVYKHHEFAVFFGRAAH
ncbi:class I SAM-dependent methyltransferase [Paenibacillus sp. J5C_2022]|uniref:class I SAM-dependent methyltransferase n=1 Tax=Paenibacillus sp. J5C2022 TaxID=2977129 RepID=UPI0021D034EF|nr:class I SAM-dependent methyltransferase [Paenibacillus sp. J5C2022]MCU6712354.1 class I SAM-dependent methyltransferase [Paenibacillus sp. J5C2022]